jgi:hypothetical protein
MMMQQLARSLARLLADSLAMSLATQRNKMLDHSKLIS